MVCGSHPELRRTSSFERTWEESAVENITNNDVVSLSLLNSSNISSKGDNYSMAENPVAATEICSGVRLKNPNPSSLPVYLTRKRK
jgi:hypothetical protein